MGGIGMGVQVRRSGGWLWIAAVAVVLFAGMFLQIAMLSRVSAVSKGAAAVDREIAALNKEAGELELRINEYHNLEQIAARARQLGMEQSDETQIRAVRVEKSDAEYTSTQAAADRGGEKVLSENFPGGEG